MPWRLPPPTDIVVAPAETRPWWLAASPQRTDATAGNEAIPVEHTPSTTDRIGAAVTAVWIGGSALAAVLPEPSVEDDYEDLPAAESDDDVADDQIGLPRVTASRERFGLPQTRLRFAVGL